VAAVARNRHEGFETAILENPSDPVVRFVYADWLYEHDESVRANVLRLEAEILSLGKPPRELGEYHCMKYLGGRYYLCYVSELINVGDRVSVGTRRGTYPYLLCTRVEEQDESYDYKVVLKDDGKCFNRRRYLELTRKLLELDPQGLIREQSEENTKI
jgi:uncharacterized protein (TIGR02996 family)